MKVSALLTSAGINIGLCTVLLSLYSILRKQPGNASIYFGRRIAEQRSRESDHFSFERFVPSPDWILKAWGYTEDDILKIAGLDAVVFLRILVFSIRIFAIASVVGIFAVLPVNYFEQRSPHRHIPSENLDVFSIADIKKGSHWLSVHCLALYIISCSACILLYFEYRNISRMRVQHIVGSPPDPSHFTILVRSIPRSDEESLSDTVRNFFTTYHASSYLSHQMIRRTGKVQKLMSSAEKIYKRFVAIEHANVDQRLKSRTISGGKSKSFQIYKNEIKLYVKDREPHADTNRKEKECAAAFVFFRTRYAAVVVSQVLQSSNPMLWVTELAPEPRDVYWSNLWVPYRQLWIRRIGTFLAAIVFMFLFILPVTLVQGLTQLDQLQQMLPFLSHILKRNFVSEVVTGYLPSVTLMLFLYTVPPTMMLFSSLEGPASHSARKRSACCKVLYFTIWNVFFVNVLSGSVISQLNVISRPKDIPNQLARAVPGQATFFITYVLTSGWAGLSSELVQLFPLLFNFLRKHIFRKKMKEVSISSFPYHTEIPKVLLFGLIGFICSIFAPLILPFLLVYFFLGYIVYRNQILNVYCSKYETGGRMWPIVHNTLIFSLVLTQIIAIGVFGIKDASVATAFTILLVISTLLFNEYCRQRFHPIFKNVSAQDIIDMDRECQQNDRVEAIHAELHRAYCQFPEDEENLPRNEIDGHVSGDAIAEGCSIEVKRISSEGTITSKPTSSG